VQLAICGRARLTRGRTARVEGELIAKTRTVHRVLTSLQPTTGPPTPQEDVTMRINFDHEHDFAPGATSGICGETRGTRLHYQLRCHLLHGHVGEHRWTPELV
jgi:hypothetical protein